MGVAGGVLTVIMEEEEEVGVEGEDPRTVGEFGGEGKLLAMTRERPLLPNWRQRRKTHFCFLVAR